MTAPQAALRASDALAGAELLLAKRRSSTGGSQCPFSPQGIPSDGEAAGSAADWRGVTEEFVSARRISKSIS
jgi:hypothetical protein